MEIPEEETVEELPLGVFVDELIEAELERCVVVSVPLLNFVLVPTDRVEEVFEVETAGELDGRVLDVRWLDVPTEEVTWAVAVPLVD